MFVGVPTNIQSRQFSTVYYWEGPYLPVPEALAGEASIGTVEEGSMSQADVFYERPGPRRPQKWRIWL